MNIGLFGGAFNPPHIGHLKIAKNILVDYDIDRILWVVSFNPPHKNIAFVDFEKRCEMVLLTINNQEKMEICTVEKEYNLSYTYDVVKKLKEKYTEDEFILIIGSDQYDQRETWYKWDLLQKELKDIIVYPRKGYSNGNINAQRIDISSSLIRERIVKGDDISDLVVPEVRDYILSKELYRR